MEFWLSNLEQEIHKYVNFVEHKLQLYGKRQHIIMQK